MLQETEETKGFVVTILIIGGISIRGTHSRVCAYGSTDWAMMSIKMHGFMN